MEHLPENSEDLQSLVERFHRANWISGISMVSKGPFDMNLTPLGLLKMQHIFEVFNKLNRSYFPDENNLQATEAGKMLLAQFSDAMSDLMPPFLSQGEKIRFWGWRSF